MSLKSSKMRRAVWRPGGHARRCERRNQDNAQHEESKQQSAGGSQRKMQPLPEKKSNAELYGMMSNPMKRFKVVAAAKELFAKT
jgi:hypothetical protein